MSAQMFLSAQGAPSLEHQRGENETHSRVKNCDSEMNFFAGDSSPANVTLSDEEEVNKHNGSLFIMAP